MTAYDFRWRGDFGNQELNELHAEAFNHPPENVDWARQVRAHSLGWVTARDGSELIGFVNVPWDGASHAFILDTMVRASVQRRGIGARLVAIAAAEARSAGCEHLHVDFEDHLRPFYFGGCGFEPTTAGLVDLVRGGEDA